jgi:hypothetical protein
MRLRRVPQNDERSGNLLHKIAAGCGIHRLNNAYIVSLCGQIPRSELLF